MNTIPVNWPRLQDMAARQNEEKRMSVKRSYLVLLAVLFAGGLAAIAPEAHALIDLEWRPACQTVDPGEPVEIGLYAVSDDLTDQSIAAIDVIIIWDNEVMQLTGVNDTGPYAWAFSGFPDDSGLDGLNDTWDNGVALYSAYAQLGVPAYATPDGLLVTTFQFSTTALPGFTWLRISPELGQYSSSRVFDGTVPGLEVQRILGRATVGVGDFDLIYASLSCAPTTGTLPFTTNFWVVMGSNYATETRRLAGRIDVTLASGSYYGNYRAGYTNLSPGECYSTSWNQLIPALPTLVGSNLFKLIAEDVTPPPYNQPPHSPSGGTDTDSCALIGSAP